MKEAQCNISNCTIAAASVYRVEAGDKDSAARSVLKGPKSSRPMWIVTSGASLEWRVERIFRGVESGDSVFGRTRTTSSVRLFVPKSHLNCMRGIGVSAEI